MFRTVGKPQQSAPHALINRPSYDPVTVCAKRSSLGRYSHPMLVPFNDLSRHMPKRQIMAAIERVVESGHFISGSAVEEFESSFAAFCNAQFCVGVSSGTDALQAALVAHAVGPSDEVITVSATFVATAAAIVHIGATPVFADIDPRSWTMDVDHAERLITERTRAIVPVHLYGRVAAIDELARLAHRHGLAIVADAAQAHGATAGLRPANVTMAFSFHPAKNLGALGDAGAVVTDDAAIADRVRELRNHGRPTGVTEHRAIGHNWRLDALQAAALTVKLPYLTRWNEHRRSAAARYGELLTAARVQRPDPGRAGEHVYHLYVVRHPRRDGLRAALATAGVETRVHYARPVHRIVAGPAVALPETDRLAEECLSLPMFPEITEREIDYTAEQVLRYCM